MIVTKKLFSNSFNFSFKNEIIFLNSFFIDRKDLIEMQHSKNAEKEKIYDSKKHFNGESFYAQFNNIFNINKFKQYIHK